MITVGRSIPEEFKKDGIDLAYDEVFRLICSNVKVQIKPRRFVYFIDENYVMDTRKGYRYENLTPDYSKILDMGLEEMKYPEEEITNKFCRSHNLVLEHMALLADRIAGALREIGGEREERQAGWFERMKSGPAEGFEEGIQRLLFVNQLFWQTDHRLTGLGAWDTYLGELYRQDMEANRLTREGALEILKDLCVILHDDYKYKSNVLMGDTGQIFVLGRSSTEGGYICNDLTYLIIEAIKEVQQPDPKCLLRVNKNTPRDLLELSLETISTGLGAPLLANDDVIIPQLMEFGVDGQDACGYGTSACWEPLIIGKSSSLNNMTVLNYLRALDNLLKRGRLDRIGSFEEFFDEYLAYLRRNLKAVRRVLDGIRFQYNPLLSVFTQDCYQNKMDVSEGGARYHHVGITSVAMGNLIDSLMNIRELVFERQEYTLSDVKRILISDYEGHEELAERLKKKRSHFGTDEEESIRMMNRITETVSEEIADFRSYLGGRMKVGLSGSAYMDAARDFGASFDGRRAGEPFTVHISNEDGNGFTEIMNCAALLRYDKGRFNGNVVDLMVNPDFIRRNWEKFVDFLELSIRAGFFEMQMNVVSSETLIHAKQDPEAFPNLIARVWGFSAYFNDLPEEYKDVLIKRALKNEKGIVA